MRVARPNRLRAQRDTEPPRRVPAGSCLRTSERAGAPRIYTYGCDTNSYPCTGAARRAMDPGTGQFVGTSGQASLIVGTLVPGTGVATNGIPTNGLIPAGTDGTVDNTGPAQYTTFF